MEVDVGGGGGGGGGGLRVEFLEELVAAVFECTLCLPRCQLRVVIRPTIRLGLTEYPKNVGDHPVIIPLNPSALPMILHASTFPLYSFESTCRRHLTKSSGVTAVCVTP